MPKTVTRVDVTPAIKGSWQDVDITAHVGSDAGNIAAAMVEFVPSVTTDTYSLRNNGSTDNRINYADGSFVLCVIGVDSNNIFEAYIPVAGSLELLGYITTAEGGNLTNAVDKMHGVDSVWTDVDISADTGAETATFAFFEYRSTGFTFSFSGLRRNGSADNRMGIVCRLSHTFVAIGVDDNEILEDYDDDTAERELWLLAWTTANVTIFTDGRDYSTGVTGAYQDTDVTPDVGDDDVGVFFYTYSTDFAQYNFGIRGNGEVHDAFGSGNAMRVHYGFVAIDEDDIFEQKIQDLRLDLYVSGAYQEPPAPPTPPEEAGLPEYAQIRSEIGDPPVYGATIVRS